MPVKCSLVFPRLSTREMGTLDYAVMEHAFDSHNELGQLCDESIYKGDLLRRLNESGMETASEVPIVLSHQDFSKRFLLDIVVFQKIIYELKTVSSISPAHEAQLIGYLYLSNSAHGKIINFRPNNVKSQFVNTSYEYEERCKFSVTTDTDAAGDRLAEMVRELVEDWGTGLAPSLYRRAITHIMSDEPEPEQMLPLSINKQKLGNQRFHLLAPETAIGVTAFQTPTLANKRSFEKLVSASPLKTFHWINIAHRQVAITTIANRKADY